MVTQASSKNVSMLFSDNHINYENASEFLFETLMKNLILEIMLTLESFLLHFEDKTLIYLY